MRNSNVAIKLNYITEEEKYSTLKRNFAQERAKAKRKPTDKITGMAALLLAIISFFSSLGELGILLIFVALAVLLPEKMEE